VQMQFFRWEIWCTWVDTYDDYYDDKTSVRGHQKMGKNKGKTPRNNQAQNAQFDAATKGLSKDIKSHIHRDIGGLGYGYHEIKNHAFL